MAAKIINKTRGVQITILIAFNNNPPNTLTGYREYLLKTSLDRRQYPGA